ncbi:MAG TPA: glycosyltransferase family 4 protein [Dissulfurispiraceae bacterium]|nr:glycosyltransferase family 4 protein [Dissulfurispiraceae bacterium]
MRILYVGWADHVHLSRWVSYFTNAGHKTRVLSTQKGRIPGSTVYQLRTKRYGLRLQAQELKIYAKIFRADIVHAHWASFGALPALAGIKPYVVTAWGSDIYRLHEFSCEGQYAIRLGLTGADIVTVDSVDLKKEVEKLGVKRERVEVVQWGVDTSVFKPGPANQSVVEQLQIAGKRIIYSPRNLDQIYNQDIVLQAFASVVQKTPDVVLIQKHYRKTSNEINDYLEKARQYGVEAHVRLVGDMDYSLLPDLYRMADVVVSVPSFDGTPMSILEGMACGAVPIVSDLPSLREWISDGENGFLVPCRNAGALADRLLRVLEDEVLRKQISPENVSLAGC